MAKQIIYGDEARAKMKTGIEKVANAVKVTLGPKLTFMFLRQSLFQV